MVLFYEKLFLIPFNVLVSPAKKAVTNPTISNNDINSTNNISFDNNRNLSLLSSEIVLSSNLNLGNIINSITKLKLIPKPINNDLKSGRAISLNGLSLLVGSALSFEFKNLSMKCLKIRDKLPKRNKK